MGAVPLPNGERSLARCDTCHRERRVDSLSFVPWSDNRTAGRWLCFDCLLTLFRLDTRAEMEQRRMTRKREIGYSRPQLLTGRLAFR